MHTHSQPRVPNEWPHTGTLRESGLRSHKEHVVHLTKYKWVVAIDRFTLLSHKSLVPSRVKGLRELLIIVHICCSRSKGNTSSLPDKLNLNWHNRRELSISMCLIKRENYKWFITMVIVSKGTCACGPLETSAGNFWPIQVFACYRAAFCWRALDGYLRIFMGRKK